MSRLPDDAYNLWSQYWHAINKDGLRRKQGNYRLLVNGDVGTLEHSGLEILVFSVESKKLLRTQATSSTEATVVNFFLSRLDINTSWRWHKKKDGTFYFS